MLYVENLIFLLPPFNLVLNPRTLNLAPLLRAAATIFSFSFNIVDFHFYRNERTQATWKMYAQGKKANGIQIFKELIDKTSEKLIRCEIQFDVTLFLCRVSNSF